MFAVKNSLMSWGDGWWREDDAKWRERKKVLLEELVLTLMTKNTHK